MALLQQQLAPLQQLLHQVQLGTPTRQLPLLSYLQLQRSQLRSGQQAYCQCRPGAGWQCWRTEGCCCGGRCRCATCCWCADAL